jgi:hypothetical protein
MNTKDIFGLVCAGIISSATFVACNKDESTPQPVPEKVKKLVKSAWKINNITVPSKVNPAEDSTLLKACMADDLINFTLTGYDFQDGAVKCDTTIFPYNKGNWVYRTDIDSLYLSTSVANKDIRWKVAEVTDTTLRINWLDSISPASKQVKTIRFKH